MRGMGWLRKATRRGMVVKESDEVMRLRKVTRMQLRVE